MKRIRLMHFRREVATGGGPETLIVDICRHIDRSRFDLSVVTFGPRGSDAALRSPLLDAVRATGTPTFVLPARHRLDPAPIRQLAQLLTEQQIDILHSHDHRSNLIAWRAARRRPTLQVATLHQPLRRYWWIRHWEILDEWVVRRFHRVVPIAENVRQEFVGKHPEMASRTITVLNGVDLDKFAAGGDRRHIREEFGVPAEAILCVTIGRLMEDKGLGYLLQAARRVRDRGEEVYWLLAGCGPQEQELRTQVASLGLANRVLFAGFRTDVRDLLAAADLMVVSSLSEGCSVAILEAMACGRATVATRVGGTPEIVAHGQTGLIVEPRQPEQLAEAVLELTGDWERRERMGCQAARRAREEFSIQRMVRRLEEVYGGLLP